MEEADGGAGEIPRPSSRHIKKRTLRNKALSISFDEKDLRDYVTGFHKRKKKRRKEAKQKLEEAQRRKRIQDRKKRKLEKEFVQYGGAPSATDSGPDELGEDYEQGEGADPIPSVSGMMTYDNGNTKVTVTTTEISHKEEDDDEMHPSDIPHAIPSSIGLDERKRQSVPVRQNKPFKRVAKHKSRAKPQNKRNKKKGKRNGSRMH
ncbi:ribosomal RNA-processing protein 17 [Malania oleifera]|uniref:ribosomal RNA-processing protein 17 n=1 Tax=Malania oleifera TaxID=397392 RepID=UPI0025ADECE7|nr:ribosomal RNA-processing protein 17 [Malania oleifera]